MKNYLSLRKLYLKRKLTALKIYIIDKRRLNILKNYFLGFDKLYLNNYKKYKNIEEIEKELDHIKKLREFIKKLDDDILYKEEKRVKDILNEMKKGDGSNDNYNNS